MFFDAIADESRARLEVEFVNLSFGAVQIIFYGCLFCVGGEGEIPYCAAACEASGAQIIKPPRVGARSQARMVPIAPAAARRRQA